jgi:hypothetical protein
MTGSFCAPHTRGVNPGSAPFYDPRCRRCQEKKALGLVTGNEPIPPRGGLTKNRARRMAYGRLMRSRA